MGREMDRLAGRTTSPSTPNGNGGKTYDALTHSTTNGHRPRRRVSAPRQILFKQYEAESMLSISSRYFRHLVTIGVVVPTMVPTFNPGKFLERFSRADLEAAAVAMKDHQRMANIMAGAVDDGPGE